MGHLVVALLLLMGVPFLYLNQIGLPDFAKSLLQAELQANGLNLEFDRLRWRTQRGLVAEGIQLQTTATNSQPKLLAEELEIRLQSLLTSTPKVASVILRNGKLSLPIPLQDTLDALALEATDLQTKISFPSPNLWVLQNFQAQCLGIQIELQAQVTNAYALKNWRFKPKNNDQPPKWPTVINQIIKICDQLGFTDTPALKINLDADAARPENTTALLTLTCDQAESPWGSLQQLAIAVSMGKTKGANGEFNSSWTLSIGHLHHPPSEICNFQLTANLTHEGKTAQVTTATCTLNSGAVSHDAFQTASLQIVGGTQNKASISNDFESTLDLILGPITGPGLSIEKIHLSSELMHQGLAWRSAEGTWEAAITNAKTIWATASQVDAYGSVRSPKPKAAAKELEISPWHWIIEKQVALQAAANDLSGGSLEAKNLQLQAYWEAPNLRVDQLKATLYDGGLDFQGSLAADTREAKLAGRFDFDVQRIRHLLTEKGKRWLRQYDFKKPPSVEVQGNVVLPEWGDPNLNWRKDVKPTMDLFGRFQVGEAAFRTVPLTSASSSIQFTNMTWRLPDLHVTRPEGELYLDYQCDARTQDYHWKIDAVVDFKALKPFLSPAQKKSLSLFEFTQPVHAQGEIWGCWHTPEPTRFKTKLATTNFVFRGVEIESLRADLAYFDQLLTARNVEIDRKEGVLRAELAKVNSNTGLITITKGFTTTDTAALAKMIGPSVERSFKSYRFAKPPLIRMHGIIPIDGGQAADAHFEVAGGPFSFWRFNVPDIRANVDWVGRNVEITNVTAPFYQGSLNGRMGLQLAPNRGAAFNLDATVQDSDLGKLFTDVLSPDIKSQGILGGRIIVNSGRTDDWDSWQGHGHISLRQGLLWDTPLFGIFSPVLNAVSPGLGNSRAESGTASFTITDSSIHTSDLTIQEPSTRLQYQGRIDFQGNLDAKVEAELLRDTPMVGRAVSIALWPISKLFIYKVGGNLRDPIAEPVYVAPKFLMNPITSILNRND